MLIDFDIKICNGNEKCANVIHNSLVDGAKVICKMWGDLGHIGIGVKGRLLVIFKDFTTH